MALGISSDFNAASLKAAAVGEGRGLTIKNFWSCASSLVGVVVVQLAVSLCLQHATSKFIPRWISRRNASYLKANLSLLLSTLLVLFFFPLPSQFLQHIQAITLTVVSYYIVRINSETYWAPSLVTFISLLILFFNHLLLDQSESPLSYNILLMSIVLRIISFSWNVFDGVANPNPTPLQKARSITSKDFPSLLDFAGYVFFFPTFSFAGIALDWKVYYDHENADFAIEGEGARSSVNVQGKMAKKGKILGMALLKVSIPLFILLWLAPVFEVNPSSSSSFSSHFFHFSSFYRLYLLAMAGLLIRLFQYIIEVFGILQCNLADIHLVPHNFEQDSPFFVVGSLYHPSVNTWIKFNVYDRFISMGMQPFNAVLGSYIILAIWNGASFGTCFCFSCLFLVHCIKTWIWEKVSVYQKGISERNKEGSYNTPPTALLMILYFLGLVLLHLSICVCMPALLSTSIWDTISLYSAPFVALHLMGISLFGWNLYHASGGEEEVQIKKIKF